MLKAKIDSIAHRLLTYKAKTFSFIVSSEKRLYELCRWVRYAY